MTLDRRHLSAHQPGQNKHTHAGHRHPPPKKEEGRTTAPVPVSRPPGDKPRAAGCTSPPYDVTCKRKVAATAATDGLIRTRRMSQAPSFTAPELTTFPEEGKQRPGLVGPGRLERPTSRLSGVRSNQLSYGPSQRPEAGSRRAETCISDLWSLTSDL
jgi:hypothetical protein